MLKESDQEETLSISIDQFMKDDQKKPERYQNEWWNVREAEAFQLGAVLLFLLQTT